ncbi:hypothetical protein JYT72_00585 [Crocinitomix catalasitica]|nr:hypothetical protein [Crocinitomix catalasitica]
MKISLQKRISTFSSAILALLLCYQCGGKDSNSEDRTTPRSPFVVFENFPEKQFEELCLDMPIQDSKILLLKSGFELKNGSGLNYHRDEDSTEIVLPDGHTLSSVKIYLRSRLYLNEPAKLVAFFEKEAVRTFKSEEFYVFNFVPKSSEFKLNLLIQESYIRISAVLLKTG